MKPSMLRVDKGTETGSMARMHAFLKSNHKDEIDPVDTVIYGPSTSNQVHSCPVWVPSFFKIYTCIL